MKRYFQRTLQVAPFIWIALTVAIIATSILYASLSVLGVSESTSLFIAFIILIGIILLGLLLAPKSFFSLREETGVSSLRSALQRRSSQRLNIEQLEPRLAEQMKRVEQLERNLAGQMKRVEQLAEEPVLLDDGDFFCLYGVKRSLAEQLIKQSSGCLLLSTGLSGVGKTELAMKFAYQYHLAQTEQVRVALLELTQSLVEQSQTEQSRKDALLTLTHHLAEQSQAEQVRVELLEKLTQSLVEQSQTEQSRAELLEKLVQSLTEQGTEWRYTN